MKPINLFYIMSFCLFIQCADDTEKTNLNVLFPAGYHGVGFVTVDSSMAANAQPKLNGQVVFIPATTNPDKLIFYRGDSLLNPDYILIKSHGLYTPKNLRGKPRVDAKEHHHVGFFYIAKHDIEVMQYRNDPVKFEVQAHQKSILDSLVMNDIIK